MEIKAYNAPKLYSECFWKLKDLMAKEESRNGEVLSYPGPVILTMYEPTERILYDPVRKANPYFHLMEAMWMLAGSDDVKFLEYYNRGYRKYAEPKSDVIWGAYGKRWRENFGFDQIPEIIHLLRKDPTTRRAVLTMWDPSADLMPRNDLPCNTHIYFRVYKGCLDMTVCNRSNDLIWGALGANIVHMTILHEIMAHDLELSIGAYRVITNNLHVYTGMPDFAKIWETKECFDLYSIENIAAYPILVENEHYNDIVADAQRLVAGETQAIYRTNFFRFVVLPMKIAYEERKRGGTGEKYVDMIRADDWKRACRLWKEWKDEERYR